MSSLVRASVRFADEMPMTIASPCPAEMSAIPSLTSQLAIDGTGGSLPSSPRSERAAGPGKSALKNTLATGSGSTDSGFAGFQVNKMIYQNKMTLYKKGGLNNITNS